MNHCVVHLVGLVEVAGDPGGVAEDEHHDDGQQQHCHGHVAPVPRGPHPLRPGRKRINKLIRQSRLIPNPRKDKTKEHT